MRESATDHPQCARPQATQVSQFDGVSSERLGRLSLSHRTQGGGGDSGGLHGVAHSWASHGHCWLYSGHYGQAMLMAGPWLGQ